MTKWPTDPNLEGEEKVNLVRLSPSLAPPQQPTEAANHWELLVELESTKFGIHINSSMETELEALSPSASLSTFSSLASPLGSDWCRRSASEVGNIQRVPSYPNRVFFSFPDDPVSSWSFILGTPTVHSSLATTRNRQRPQQPSAASTIRDRHCNRLHSSSPTRG